MSTQRLQQQDWSNQQRRALTSDELHTALAALPGWQLDGDAIAKSYAFANYYETMAFVNATAWVSHHENHHPDLEVGYSQCSIRYSTHAIGGLSENDFSCAAKIDAWNASSGA